MDAPLPSSPVPIPVPETAAAAPERDWSMFPIDELSVIFGFISSIDILTGAGLVCRSWRRVAMLPHLWRRIDMMMIPSKKKRVLISWSIGGGRPRDGG
uniref:F-box domain-containing protein n=1 Tax=Leersia perrieri TaxID=77586 RepID=A0A0D9X571_9ORYZ